MAAFTTQQVWFFGLGFAIFSVGSVIPVLWIVGFFSGWHALSRRYRNEMPFPAHRRTMQSGTMRGGASYNNVLRLGSDSGGIYLGMPFFFRIGHPQLFIPWHEIEVEEPRRWFFVTVQTLRLGPERIPLRLRQPVVDFLRQGRGPS
jgi:hypothetical protein